MTTRAPITPGMAVRLKSGGPNMLVQWVKEGEAMCIYIRDGDTVRQTFPEGALDVLLAP